MGGLEYDEKALLDTGASYTVLSVGLADELSSEVGSPIEEVSMSTRYGLQEGMLYHIRIQLMADRGADLPVEATVAIFEDWPGPTVLGFKGFMDRIRIALDPGFSVGDEPTLFFGRP